MVSPMLLAASPSQVEVAVEALDNKDDLLWNSICSVYAPKLDFLVGAVESLPKIHVVRCTTAPAIQCTVQ